MPPRISPPARPPFAARALCRASTNTPVATYPLRNPAFTQTTQSGTGRSSAAFTANDYLGHNMEHSLSPSGHRRVDQRSCDLGHVSGGAMGPVAGLTSVSGSGRDGGAAE